MKKIVKILISLIFIIILLSGCIEKDITGSSYGSLYSNDCGVPIGGFEWVGDYYANLTIDSGIGKLIIQFKTGLGDPIEKHEYTTFIKKYTSEEMILIIDGIEVILEWIENDNVWNEWHNHYIGSYGIYMNNNETIGKIKTDVFPGLKDNFYVELRLPKIQ
ncbi:MAG: hypothetical protein JSV67_03490 [Thermoplasmatales archaeon]|nr:MAG: hypothetical protein JSV67_03490 [Thermoplasmatales archaeon]